MSSNLEANPTRPGGILSLSSEMKYALRKRFDQPIDEVLTEGSDIVAYLQGLEDSGIKDASKLIEYIEKHEIMSVNEEY